MTNRAKIFKNGGSQAIRLPKEYRFENQEEVLISRQGHRVILEPVVRRWSRDFLQLAGAAPDFELPSELEAAEPVPDLD